MFFVCVCARARARARVCGRGAYFSSFYISYFFHFGVCASLRSYKDRMCTCVSKINSLYMRLHGTRYRHLINQEEVVPLGYTRVLLKRTYFVVVIARLSHVWTYKNIDQPYFAVSLCENILSSRIISAIDGRRVTWTIIADNNIYTALHCLANAHLSTCNSILYLANKI